MFRFIFLLGLFLLTENDCYAQFQPHGIPNSPQVEPIQPVQPGKSYNPSPPQPNPSPLNQYNHQQNAIIQQQNREQLKRMGFQLAPTDEEIMEEMEMIRRGILSKIDQQRQEIANLIDEARNEAIPYNNTPNNRIDPAIFATQNQPYINALQSLKSMLEGKKPLSLKDAYYQIEAAYGNPYLSYKDYNKIIKESVEFIKKWLVQNGYSLTDNEALNYGIQQFMANPLTITLKSPESNVPAKKIKHNPFFYDYNDFKGERDFRNYFITKCLATGSGQCNSMPAVYLILAEALGAKAYLTFAPLHSFVKYPNNKGQILSYEPTSHWLISDRWYIEHMYINQNAIRSGIYLSKLNKKEIVANCLIDLAHGHLRKFGYTEGKFVESCLATAAPYFAKTNNIHAYLLISSYYIRQLDQVLTKNNIKDLREISRVPEAKEIYDKLQKNEEIIKSLGYQDMPEQAYEQMMKEQEFKGQKQAERNITGKEKRNLFEATY